MFAVVIAIILISMVVVVAGTLIYLAYRSSLREAKNYERGLKMVPMLIHLPPISDDL